MIALLLLKWRKALFVLGAIAYVLASYAATYYAGRHTAQAECDAGKLAAQLEKAQADVDRLQRAALAKEIETKFLRAARESVDGQVAALEQELQDERSKQPAPVEPSPVVEHAAPQSCPVPDDGASADDLRRLRGIGKSRAR